jgi:hypothetical protein
MKSTFIFETLFIHDYLKEGQVHIIRKSSTCFWEEVMGIKRIYMMLLMISMVIIGCATRLHDVSYDEVERTNHVEVMLVSGNKVVGTLFKIEPHQLTILQEDRKLRPIAKSSIRSIKRKPPVYDDYGRGISEEEIASVQTNKNTVVYGIGGGALSVGTSFFLGSLAGQDSVSGSTVLTASVIGGGGLGTFLFVRAGKAKDRKVAIETIRDKRRSAEISPEEDENATPEELQKRLDAEKKKQEELRKEREKLLRELEGEKKKKKKKEGS